MDQEKSWAVQADECYLEASKQAQQLKQQKATVTKK
jgi:hypothetical protein